MTAQTEEAPSSLAFVVIGFLLGCIVATMVTYSFTVKAWHNECIRRGVAHYDPQTGLWKWKVPQETTSHDE